MKMNCLVDRLIDLGHWPLAIAICRYIKEPSKKGIHRIESAKSEKEAGKTPNFKSLSEVIASKFADYPEVSFADVAMKAADANLNELAEFLLEKETHLSRQVEMLLKLNKPERALAKAARSQKPDLRKQPNEAIFCVLLNPRKRICTLNSSPVLVHFVLAHLRQTQKKEVIDHLVLKLPPALCLYQDYLKEEAPRHLLALYIQKDDFARQTLYYLKESQSTPWNPFDNKDKIDGLLKAEKSLINLKKQATALLVAETSELLRLCETLDGKPDFSDVDRTSVRSVYMWSVAHEEDILAEQLRKNFKIPEKACYMWKIESFARHKLWHHVESLFRSKKVITSYMVMRFTAPFYKLIEYGTEFI
ncbi:unnamed protein product [Gongylonema pulchrum]|uniref:Vps16 C-terminal domain-containing protein n=1 Tax=Gongylonema pulchrum TaxID=637853 RepID=A0A3P7P038_9BILA|nr:unnamed protein product [Gongylonema pulchrum]